MSESRSPFRGLFLTLVPILAILAVASGIRVVPQGHRGAVVRLGTLRPDLLPPGMHWVPPWPISEVRSS